MKTSDGTIPFKKSFCLLSICVLGCFTSISVNAQDISPNAIPRATTALAQAPMFSDAELDQMLAPIALYPDVLLTQTLIASTYPSEAIEAGNWLKENPNLRGKEAVEAASQTNWDDSIKSLAAFPEILVPMAEYPDWTTGLGNAFLSQQQQLMNRVQFLRQKAKEQGNLKTNDQVKVQTTGQQTIVIEPATTQVVYVPYYNPTVVYGTWWWPAYSPVYWNPWPYAGYATGYSSGFMWSGVGLWFSFTSYRPIYDWHTHRVYIHDRHYRRPGAHRKPMPRREWSHKPEHRHDVSYRDKTYRPGPDTPKPGHGMPNKKPNGQNGPHGSMGQNGKPGVSHMPGKNDRPSFDKDKRPGSPHMGLTDKNPDGNRPGPSKGKPFDIPRKENTLANHNRPSNGHGNPVGPGMSGTRPVLNGPGQRPSADKPVGRPEPGGQPTWPQVNRPNPDMTVNRPANKPVSGQPSNSSATDRPMQIPSVNRPSNSNRPVQSPSINRPSHSQSASGAPVKRPTDTRPAPNPSMNRPTVNPLPASPAVNRPQVNRPAQSPSVNRPPGSRPTPNESVSRPVPNRPSSPSISRPASNSRPAVASSSRPSSGSSASRPAPGRPAANRPSGGGGSHASSAPTRPSSSNHQSKPSSAGKDNDRGHGR